MTWKQDLTGEQAVILTFGFYVWHRWSDSAKTLSVLSTLGQPLVSDIIIVKSVDEQQRCFFFSVFVLVGPGYFSSRSFHGDFLSKAATK